MPELKAGKAMEQEVGKEFWCKQIFWVFCWLYSMTADFERTV